MRHLLLIPSLVTLFALTAVGAESSDVATGKEAKPNSLTAAEIVDGWLLLFDGETKFGWEHAGTAAFEKGVIRAGGEDGNAALTTTTEFGDFELRFEYRGEGTPVLLMNFKDHEFEAPKEVIPGKTWVTVSATVQSSEKEHVTQVIASNDGSKGKAYRATSPGRSRTVVGIGVPKGKRIELRSVRLKPLGAKPLFNGKDLTGWKELPGKQSKFTVTPKGEINVKDGNGELQTEGQWADFVLQLDILSSGEHLNSGVFFRCLPGQFWQGYEAQIRNEWKGYQKDKARDEKSEDRTKPIDYGTGGIYNRQASRKVVSNDNEWFTMTVVASGDHLATWVNGFQTADWTDDREPAESARNGKRLGKGCISVQGHDPTTDLSFRKIKLAELPEAAAPKPAPK